MKISISMAGLSAAHAMRASMLGLLLGSTDVVAQQARVTIDVLEPRAALAKLASEDAAELNAASAVIQAAFSQRIDSTTHAIVIGNYDRYTNAQRQELLDGVERIAREGGTRAMTAAFSIMAVIGLDTATSAPERVEIPARLLRIYRQSQTLTPKSLAVSRLGEFLALGPRESPEIIQVLVDVATAPASADRVHPQAAVDALINAGEPGIAVLRQLHAAQSIRDYGTSVFLREYARRGFPPERRGVGPPKL